MFVPNLKRLGYCRTSLREKGSGVQCANPVLEILSPGERENLLAAQLKVVVYWVFQCGRKKRSFALSGLDL
jgi:hypothetical protein